jgi:hypothetical protein
MATITYRSVKGTPLTNTEIDSNFSNLNDEVATKLASADYTASDILTKIKTVDGSGSGLDADLLDGLNAVSGATGASIISRDTSGNFSANTATLTQLNAGNFYLGASGTITFEGATDDAYETTLTVVDPTADRTITFPNLTGTVVVTGATGIVTNTMLAGSISNDKLSNSAITIDGNAVSLGGSVSITGANLTWTGSQTFRDNKFILTDDVDTTKVLNLQLSGISTGTTRTLTAPDASGTIATQAYLATYLSSGSATASLASLTSTSGAFTTLSSTGNTTFNAVSTVGETTSVSATAATGTIQYDALTQSVVYYTSNATGNWTLNIRGNSTTTLNSVMAVGETRTIIHLVTQGSTAYYNNAVTIDGTSVTPKWQGSVPVAGNISGIDAYTYTIIKTASATFTVLASQVQFK